MTTPDVSRIARCDAYIADAPEFARPILLHLREVVHAACPEVQEVMKWSRPFFDHRGCPMCFMSAFKGHCGFGFWRAKEMEGLPFNVGEEGMGQFGRLLTLADLPPKRELVRFIKAAMKLNESAVKPVKPKAAPKAALAMPDDLAAALERNTAAAKHFDAFSPSAKREYVEWVVEAKREETRATRIATTVEWSAEGRTRHWKYQS